MVTGKFTFNPTLRYCLFTIRHDLAIYPSWTTLPPTSVNRTFPRIS